MENQITRHKKNYFEKSYLLQVFLKGNYFFHLFKKIIFYVIIQKHLIFFFFTNCDQNKFIRQGEKGILKELCSLVGILDN